MTKRRRSRWTSKH